MSFLLLFPSAPKSYLDTEKEERHFLQLFVRDCSIRYGPKENPLNFYSSRLLSEPRKERGGGGGGTTSAAAAHSHGHQEDLPRYAEWKREEGERRRFDHGSESSLPAGDQRVREAKRGGGRGRSPLALSPRLCTSSFPLVGTQVERGAVSTGG